MRWFSKDLLCCDFLKIYFATNLMIYLNLCYAPNFEFCNVSINICINPHKFDWNRFLITHRIKIKHKNPHINSAIGIMIA